VGATSASCTGDYAVSRAWAAALHEHPDWVDGIRYRARHDDDGFAIALFNRVDGLVADMQTAPLTHPTNRLYGRSTEARRDRLRASAFLSISYFRLRVSSTARGCRGGGPEAAGRP
jgi:hypothetical protein